MPKQCNRHCLRCPIRFLQTSPSWRQCTISGRCSGTNEWRRRDQPWRAWISQKPLFSHFAQFMVPNWCSNCQTWPQDAAGMIIDDYCILLHIIAYYCIFIDCPRRVQACQTYATWSALHLHLIVLYVYITVHRYVTAHTCVCVCRCSFKNRCWTSSQRQCNRHNLSHVSHVSTGIPSDEPYEL